MAEEFVNVDEAKEKNVITSKCPSCGANMEYDAESKLLKCPFCGTTKEIPSEASAEQEFDNLLKANNTWSKEAVVYQCKNCGVKEVISMGTVAKCCSYCGTPNVVKTDEIAGLKPNAVVPFEISKDKACECVKTWAKKKFYATREFKKNVNPEEIKGVYDPAFTFDSDTFSHYNGRLGEYYYVTKKVNGREERERKVRYFHVSGNFNHFFDDVLVEASSNINQKSLDKLQPFDTNNSKQYDSSFLLGFSANQYSKDGKACWENAKGMMDSSLRRMILNQYHYDTVDYLNVDTQFYDRTYKYLLLPIYVGHCLYHKKNYNFFVNGKSGKVTGKVPLSALKITLTVILALALIALVVFLCVWTSREQ